MKRSNVLIMTLMCLAMGSSISYSQTGNPEQTEASAPKVSEQEMKEAFSFLMGYRLGRDISTESSSIQISDFDKDILLKAIEEGLSGKQPSIDTNKVDAALAAFAQKVQERDGAKAKANADAGKAFLAENAKKDGVVTTKSGLQYKIITKGDGRKYDAAKDGKNAVCTITYEGKLIDGTTFDKSDEPVEMAIGQVVPGFSEALSLMPIGSEWELVIPSDLAYGERGPAPLGANATLCFTVKMLDIQPSRGNAGNPIELTPEIEEQLRAQGLMPVEPGTVTPVEGAAPAPEKK